MIVTKQARPTLTAVELDIGDELHFTLVTGETQHIKILDIGAGIYRSNKDQPGRKGPVIIELEMTVMMEINGCPVTINRWVGSQRSFYEPWNLFGMHLWFDACSKLFDYLQEVHGPCRPRKHVRLAVQDATQRICPVLLHPWCPVPEGGLRIEDCYEGSDCWLGPYFGTEAHGGLDINHPAGTPLWTPLAIDDHYMFNQVAAGDNNNRWRGLRRWRDQSTWILQTAHIIRLLAPEHEPLDAGQLYAHSAGVRVGIHEHSHFVFGVVEPGQTQDDQILLDPWILFWQMYQDRAVVIA